MCSGGIAACSGMPPAGATGAGWGASATGSATAGCAAPASDLTPASAYSAEDGWSTAWRRNASIGSRAAIAESVVGSVPGWYAPMAIRSDFSR
jgi:hypothetical protein